jgi:hypothetical protein
LTLVYLYAVAGERARDWLERAELRGIGSAAVRPVVASSLCGAVSDVPVADFDQEPLDRNVGDATWLAPRAEAHQAVNARLLEGLDAVIPLAFGTIFRSDDGVRRVLGERASDLAAALERVAGHVEWVLTLERDDALAARALDEREPIRTLAADAAGSAPGKAYLLRRKLDDARRAELRAQDASARDALAAALHEVVEEATDEPLVEGGPVARITVFLPRSREADLGSAVTRLNDAWMRRGYTARATGPWPAYRFGASLGGLR